MPRNSIFWPSDVPEKTFDEKMKEGARRNDGIEQSMPLREQWERPWSKQVHKPTRCNHDSKS